MSSVMAHFGLSVISVIKKICCLLWRKCHLWWLIGFTMCREIPCIIPPGCCPGHLHGARSQHSKSGSLKIGLCKRCIIARWTCMEKMFLSNRKKAHGVCEIGLGFITWQIERIMSIWSMFCMRTNLVTEPDTAWQGIRSCIEFYAGRSLKGTFGTHYSKPISLFRLKVTLSGWHWSWQPLTVITTDCLTATDITSLKTCLAYYRLVPLVGAVGHVSQTVVIWDGALWFWSVIKTIMTDSQTVTVDHIHTYIQTYIHTYIHTYIYIYIYIYIPHSMLKPESRSRLRPVQLWQVSHTWSRSYRHAWIPGSLVFVFLCVYTYIWIWGPCILCLCVCVCIHAVCTYNTPLKSSGEA